LTAQWNNKISYWKRSTTHQPRLFITSCIDWDLSDIKIWKNIVFEEVGNCWELKSFLGLKNFVRLNNFDKKVVIFDNHNHALFFWSEFFTNKQKKLPVIHIDQHSDLNTPDIPFLEEFSLESVFNYTNFVCDVWNFIIPALYLWVIDFVEQIRTEYKLLNFSIPNFDFILDIDLDFWSPEMSIECFEKTITKVKSLIKKASLVTIATSPYFIEQDYAISIVEKLFSD